MEDIGSKIAFIFIKRAESGFRSRCREYTVQVQSAQWLKGPLLKKGVSHTQIEAKTRASSSLPSWYMR
jgi:hypothetical protein